MSWYKIIKKESQWKWHRCTMCMNSGALFPGSINGWVNKRTFTAGLQNVNPHSEMSNVLSGVFKKPHATELHNLSDYTRLNPMLSRCQNSWFLPSLQDFTNGFEKSPFKTTMPECHANLLLTETLCQLLQKATLARIIFHWLTKILWISEQRWAYLTELTEGERCTITCPCQTDACCTFYWTH